MKSLAEMICFYRASISEMIGLPLELAARIPLCYSAFGLSK